MKRGKRSFLCITLILSLLMGLTAFGAEPIVQAKAAILAEATTGRILYEKNSTERMYPASMTKLLTALVAMDYFSPTDVVEVGAEINDISLDSSKAGHVRGESITVENLIRGLIIPSGNDTANVVAVATARKAYPDKNLTYQQAEKQFVELLNEKAASLGATDSHFVNAHGYHHPEHYTTARDMLLICQAALQNELLMEIAGETSFSGNGLTGSDVSADGKLVQDYTWRSHNALINQGTYYYPYATGIKTGFTNEAGSCVAASAAKDSVSLIAIIFNSGDTERWMDATILFDYGFDAYDMVTLHEIGETVGEVALTKHNRLKGDTLELVAGEKQGAYLTTEEQARITVELSFDEAYLATPEDGQAGPVLTAPIEENAKVGKAVYSLDGDALFSTPLYAKRTVEKQSILSIVRYFIQHTLFTGKGAIIALVAVIVVILLIVIILLLRGRNRYGRRYSGGGYRMRKTGRRRRRRW